MVSTLQGCENNTVNINASANFYNPIGACDRDTEDDVEVSYQTAGTISLLTWLVGTNANTANRVCRLRINNLNSNQSATITASTTGIFQDAVNSDAIIAGDDITLSVPAGGTGSMNASVTTVFAATSNTVSKWGCNSGPDGFQFTDFAGASTTYRIAVYGFDDSTQTTAGEEDQIQIKVKTAGTWKNFSVLVDSNARTTTTTGKTRINGADGAQSVSIGSTATGLFEDTTNEDSLVVDDEICYALVTGTGTSIIAINEIHTEFETTNNTGILPSGNTTATDITVNAGVTNFYSIYGLPETVASETDEIIQLQIDRDRVLSDMSVNVAANTTDGSSTLRTRIDQVNGAQSVSIPANTTGFFDETVDEDTVTTNEIINYQIIAGTGTGTISVSTTSVVTNEPATPATGGTDEITGRYFGTRAMSMIDVLTGMPDDVEFRLRPLFARA